MCPPHSVCHHKFIMHQSHHRHLSIVSSCLLLCITLLNLSFANFCFLFRLQFYFVFFLFFYCLHTLMCSLFTPMHLSFYIRTAMQRNLLPWLCAAHHNAAGFGACSTVTTTFFPKQKQITRIWIFIFDVIPESVEPLKNWENLHKPASMWRDVTWW